MSATFEIFPTADDAEPAPVKKSIVGLARANDIALEDIDLQSLALAYFAPSREALKTATDKLADVVHDLSTAGKLADAKSLRHRLINLPLAEARKVSGRLKSKLAAASKEVGAELGDLEVGFEAADKLITPQIEARDAELAAEKAERERLEAARVARHRANLATLAGYVGQLQGKTSEQIHIAINQIYAIEIIPEQWEEFTASAESEKIGTLAALQALLIHTKTAEDEAAAREAQRVENERVAAALAEQARVLAEKQAEIDRQLAEIAAAKKAEADRLQAAEDALVSSIKGVSRRIEGDTVPYIEKAIIAYETAARDFENGASERVRAAILEGRDYLDDRLRAATQAARQAAEDEANARAQEAAAELASRLAAGGEWTPADDAVGAAMTGLSVERFNAAAEALGAQLSEPAADMDDIATKAWTMPAGPVTFAEPEPTTDPMATLIAHIDEAFVGKFAAHPKPPREWWGALRRLTDEVRESVAA